MLRSVLAGSLLAGALALLLSGCLPENCWPESRVALCAAQSGTATVAVPAGFSTPMTSRVGGASCLGPDGTCSVRPSFFVVAIHDQTPSPQPQVPNTYSVLVVATLPVIEGAGTFTLPSSGPNAVTVAGQVDLGQNGFYLLPLFPLAGTIAVDGSSRDGFHASFDLEVETPDHQVFSATGGTADIGQCHVDVTQAGCSPAD